MMNNIALIRTRWPILNAYSKSLPICSLEESSFNLDRTLLGAVGMGTTTTTRRHQQYPNTLKEIFLKQTLFQPADPENLQACPVDIVCTLPVFTGSNVCLLDDGGALFRFECGTLRPQCLVGVTSFSAPKANTPEEFCNNGSYFSKLLPFKDWIDFILNNFTFKNAVDNDQ